MVGKHGHAEEEEGKRGEASADEEVDRFALVKAGLAEGLSVAAACRRAGLHRSVYYRRRNSLDETQPRFRVTSELRGRMLALAAEFPAWGCDRIAYCLKLEGHELSSPSVQKILVGAGLGKRREREARAAAGRSADARDESEPFAPPEGSVSERVPALRRVGRAAPKVDRFQTDRPNTARH